MKKKITQLLFAIGLLLSINTYSQVSGNIDASFNVGTGADNSVSTIAIQSDGKVIIVGSFTTYNGKAINRIARLNTDGSLDTNFIVGTGANGNIGTTAIQSDGKIIIGGFFTSYNGTAINNIARLNADGSLDNNFVVGTGTNSEVQTSIIQSDGKIIIGGLFTTYNSTARSKIARLNADGTLDATFIVGAGASDEVDAIAIQSNGKIIIGGAFSKYNGIYSNNIARLNTDGSLDVTFNIGSGAQSDVYTIAIQIDGKIIISGAFLSFNTSAYQVFMARLNIDGSVDAFGVGWPADVADYNISTTVIQSDGKVIIGGLFDDYSGGSVRNIARLSNTISTGIINSAQASDLSIFPNPNNGDFTISLNKEETFSLVNNLGQTIQTIQLNQSNNNSANVSGVEPGFYFLVGKSNALLNYKVVVSK
jgi:uncharacterized delta-60 repeat protein